MLLHNFLDDLSAHSTNQIAIRTNKVELSYANLNRQSHGVAAWLLQHGCQKGDRVALYVPKTPEAIVLLFGILRAGAVYVPIDPTAPLSRAEMLIQESGASFCFAELAKRPKVDAEACLLCSDFDAMMSCDAEIKLPTTVVGADLAAILFTSGSTGVPKGVMLTHTNILAFVNWAIERFSLDENDRFTSHAPLHFDLSTLDIFASLHVGGSVFLLDEMTKKFPSAVAQILEKQKITVWYSVPTALRFLCERGGLEKRDLSALRHVFFAGEVFPIPALRQVMQVMSSATFVNLYGPTETNVCTYHETNEVPEIHDKDIPIGLPCEHLKVVVVRDDGGEADVGEMGEIIVSGSAVMSGYWGDKEKTQASLWLGKEDTYCTGDYGVRLKDGNIIFRGRKDCQIKIRGHRVELGEVESVLFRHKNIKEAVVTFEQDDNAEDKLVAHIVLDTDGIWDADNFRDYCMSALPIYEVPAVFKQYAALPRTSTGKADRKRLTTGER